MLRKRYHVAKFGNMQGVLPLEAPDSKSNRDPNHCETGKSWQISAQDAMSILAHQRGDDTEMLSES